MDGVNPIFLISFIAVFIMMGTLIIAYIKGLMITYALIVANIIVFIFNLIPKWVLYPGVLLRCYIPK